MMKRTLQVLETTCSILSNNALTHISSNMEGELSVEKKFCIRSKLKLLK